LLVSTQSHVAKRHVGRFSEGLEQLPELPSKLHVGHFSEGTEQLHAAEDAGHRRRFSEGMERVAEDAALWKLHRGSFADGFEEVRRGTRRHAGHAGIVTWLHRNPHRRRPIRAARG
jgi:hypothetical protein